MKKLLLTLGAISAIVAPVASVVACGSSNNSSNPFSGGVKTAQSIAELKKEFPTYYNTLADDAKGEDLFNSLRSIQSTHLAGVGSYNDLWETYKDAFIDKYDEKDNTILDIYSENPNGKDPYEFKPGTDQDKGHHSSEADAYNREHMIPQSIFGKTSEHIHNDAHFIYPTDAVVNGERNNYPYDYVDKPTRVFEQGARLGMGKDGETAFEPIDAFKGDVARATLYFVMTWKGTSYDKQLMPFAPFGGKTIGGVKLDYLRTYLEWDHKDAISQFDVDRNNAIAKDEHGIRNPFVDMPKLVDLIWGEEAGSWTEHKDVPTTLKPLARGVKATTGAAGTTGTPKPQVTLKPDYTPVDSDFPNVAKIVIDDATQKAFVSGLVSGKHVPALVAAWPDIIKTATTIDEVAEQSKEAMYPGNTDTGILANVKAWLGRVLKDLQ